MTIMSKGCLLGGPSQPNETADDYFTADLPMSLLPVK